MKAILYGSYPASERGRIERFLATPWELVSLLDEAPAQARARELADADALVTSRYGRSDPPAPRLRLLQCSSTGTERINRAHLPPGCALCNLFGHEIAMAEYVMWAVLDWALDLRNPAARFRDGTWTLDEWNGTPMHGEVFGKTLGIVGFGRIGREAARRAKALGMDIAALSAWRSGPPDPALVDRAFTREQAPAFLAGVDYLAVCAPLDPTTRGMVDGSWFAAMRRDAVLIHVGRGPVIDEQSLFAALEARTIRGATLDVWYVYPKLDGKRVAPSRLPFHALPNVVMTPHNSGRSEESWDRRFREVAKNLDALARGEKLRNVLEM
jgi:phosphoglycerate dehydrogenase-like enzyme